MLTSQFSCCKCDSGACIIHEGPDGAVVVTCECGTLLGSWRELMNRDSTSTRERNSELLEL